METYTPTDRTQVKRVPKRAAYDKAVVHTILDAGYVCHVGFAVDGQPYVIPTGYARDGEMLYIHGSPASRMIKALGQGLDVCVTVTLIDGFVLARSAFHHSMNYRSVVALGRARVVAEIEEKRAALRCFTNHIAANRWEESRQPTDHELKATLVLALPLSEVSAKVRVGPPIDDEEDYALPVWAGVIPVRMQPGLPIADERVMPGVKPVDPRRLVTSR